MPTFIVTISRSASETVELHVEAQDQDTAEEKIGNALDKPHRVNVSELILYQGVKVATHDFCGDDESSWEIV